MLRDVVAVRATLVLLMLLTAANPPVFAQFELAGSWAAKNHEVFLSDAIPTDYTGIPLNDEGRAKALSYSESQLGMIERQCQGWPAFYLVLGPFDLKIWSEVDPGTSTVISWTIGAWEDRAPLIIWMDRRPEPSPYAEHTRGGFTTGAWEGNTLVARTTHMKAGFIRRNGVPSSDQAAMTTRFFRHGDILTILAVIDDPIYLQEPLILSKSWRLTATPVSPVGPPCITTYQGTGGESVPHYLPEKNPFIDEMTTKYNIPREAALGGAETLYPEYRKKLRR